MVNNEDFVKRLRQLMAYLDISASALADKTGTQRSGMSHLLSGRNKPGLDFILKVHETFPEIDLYWLLLGKGTFPPLPAVNDASTERAPASKVDIKEAPPVSHDLFSMPENKDEIKPAAPPQLPVTTDAKQIERIIIFYTDGTFSEYKP